MNSAVLQMTVENAKNGNTRSAWLLEEEIAQRGLQDAYIEALIDATNTPNLSLDIWPSTDALWRFMHATPEQRAQAFVAVCALEREV